MEIPEEVIEVEIEAENLLLARHELVEIDRMRNGNREALTQLRKRAKTTKTSVPSPFESLMRDIDPRPLVKEVCATCSHHNAREKTLLMFPGTDTFVAIPFHAAHTIIEEDQACLDFDSKKLQSNVKEKALLISEKGAISDKINHGVLKSMVTLTDKPRIVEKD
ncbi:P53/DNA damage-regulated protein [Perilla frutescens var. frutescens]|nr:P53/DNA damage-regulated protein [Perilla frutescens var. frutescens]